MNDWTWNDLSLAWDRTQAMNLAVDAGLLMLLLVVVRLAARLTIIRRSSWLRDVGLAVFIALPWALLFNGGNTFYELQLLNACQTNNANYFASPDGVSRLVVYSFDCSPTDRLFMVSLLKKDEPLPRYNSAVMLYQASGTPHAAGDEQNFMVFWTGSKLVTVLISDIADKDGDTMLASAGEDVYVRFQKLEKS